MKHEVRITPFGFLFYSDIHPIDSREKFKSVGLKKLSFSAQFGSLSKEVPDSTAATAMAWEQILKRKDNLATKYVEEVKDFR